MDSSKEKEQDIYTKLAMIMTGSLWGWGDHVPSSGVLQQALKDNFSEKEALVLSELPHRPLPLETMSLDEIAANSSFPQEQLGQILDGLVERKLLYKTKTKVGEKAYALPTMAFGFNQVWFWEDKPDEHTRLMAKMDVSPEYLKAKVDMFTTIDTKAFRYIPVTESIDSNWQNVYPTETIEKVVKNAKKIALANCPCRIRYELNNGESCGHPKDVCMKLDELAEFVIDTGLAKEVTHEEALDVIKKANEAGLVHFTDNTGEGIKHICNCCGCACWNVGPIRRRQVPRDMLMATFFLRETVEDQCTGCENCIDICPVNALRIEDGLAKVDLEICIGCGVCVPRCPTGAAKLFEKDVKPLQNNDFVELHTKIHEERASRLKKD